MVTCTAHSSPSLPLGKPLDYCAKGPYSIQLFVFFNGSTELPLSSLTSARSANTWGGEIEKAVQN